MASWSVGIGELKVSGKPEDTLTALGLGSCVAFALYDPQIGLGGLAHCMLPTRHAHREAPPEKPALYVDGGLEALLGALAAAGAQRSRLRAALVGGAAMFDFNGSSMLDVGRMNLEVAEEALRRSCLRVLARDLGGNRGRTAILGVGDGCLTVRTEGAEQRLCRLGQEGWRKAA